MMGDVAAIGGLEEAELQQPPGAAGLQEDAEEDSELGSPPADSKDLSQIWEQATDAVGDLALSMSEDATAKYEAACGAVQRYLHASRRGLTAWIEEGLHQIYQAAATGGDVTEMCASVLKALQLSPPAFTPSKAPKLLTNTRDAATGAVVALGRDKTLIGAQAAVAAVKKYLLAGQNSFQAGIQEGLTSMYNAARQNKVGALAHLSVQKALDGIEVASQAAAAALPGKRKREELQVPVAAGAAAEAAGAAAVAEGGPGYMSKRQRTGEREEEGEMGLRAMSFDEDLAPGDDLGGPDGSAMVS